MAQMGFFDVENRYAALDAKNDPLVRIHALAPWEAFRSRLENVWRKPPDKRKSNAGCKPWDAIVMFKAHPSVHPDLRRNQPAFYACQHAAHDPPGCSHHSV